jgi:CO/xanthine dehydrogenase Mo-binding subunit
VSALRCVGQPIRPVDGLDKVMGRARYVGDYQLPGMLVARVLRSPLPHARILRLDVSPALQVPGVVAAITPDDFVDHGSLGWPVKDAFILAYEKVRYVGDPIAAVAAETAEAAEAGVRAIRCELEELPGVFDMRRALDPDAPLIPLVPPIARGNLVVTQIVRNGEPRAILPTCDLVLDETYACAHQEHAYLETEGALAIPEADGGVTIYANDQSPFINRDNLMMVLGLPADRVRVIQAVVGGSFGGKDDIGYQTSAQAARLALKAGRPVRLTLSRAESMLASYKREAMQYRIQLGASRDGTLRTAAIEAIADSGAYASMTPLAAWRATVHAAGAYRYEAVQVDTQVVYTNNAYSGAFRGFGNTESVAVIEQAVDELAERLGQDPIEFRLKNCLRQNDRTMTGAVVEHEVGLADCLAWVRQPSGWDRKRAEYADQAGRELRRGIGVACYFHGSSLGGEGADYATATLKIEDDYSVTLTSGLTDYGQGSRTVYTLIAAEVLGLHPERIRMLRPDTQHSIESGPTVASRATMVGGNATRLAAGKLQETLLTAAAHRLGCSPAQVARHGDTYVAPSEDSLSFEQVVDHARQMGLVLSAQGRWQIPAIEWDFKRGTGTPYFCYVFGAQVAEVSLDLRTGQAQVLGVWAAHDGGRIIFPQGAAGQMFGGIAQGIGYALLEDMRFDHGYAQHTNYDGYLIPTALDVPPIEATFLETDFPDGPFGAKNLAEPVMIATAPAIANALAQATGVRRRCVPVTPEQLLLGRELTRPGARQRALEALGSLERPACRTS